MGCSHTQKIKGIAFEQGPPPISCVPFLWIFSWANDSVKCWDSSNAVSQKNRLISFSSYLMKNGMKRKESVSQIKAKLVYSPSPFPGGSSCNQMKYPSIFLRYVSCLYVCVAICRVIMENNYVKTKSDISDTIRGLHLLSMPKRTWMRKNPGSERQRNLWLETDIGAEVFTKNHHTIKKVREIWKMQDKGKIDMKMLTRTSLLCVALDLGISAMNLWTHHFCPCRSEIILINILSLNCFLPKPQRKSRLTIITRARWFQ